MVKRISFVMVLMVFVSLPSSVGYAQVSAPSLSLNLGDTDSPEGMVPILKIVAMLTILSIAPAILLMMTSFTRILIVLSFVRQALGTMTMPPNQVILGLALFLTMFTMSPVWSVVYERSLEPYIDHKIGQEDALERFLEPVRSFMLQETRKDDLALFYNIAKKPKPQSKEEVEMSVLMPAFMISELKTAFQIGFLIYIPFLIIDMVISSVLMAMGMMMLPPTVVSLPFKLVLFVLVDGWSLIVSSVVRSFNIF